MYTTQIIDLPCELYHKQATIYKNPDQPIKGCILYFHGGGLLYGNREDLPELHLNMLTDTGYTIIAFDYPLAPAVKMDTILKDVYDSIQHYLDHPSMYLGGSDDTDMMSLPYFLWGRSAGAYLSLLAAGKGSFKRKPNGVLSYYGYGFLCDGWFLAPSKYYLTLPPVSDSIWDSLPSEVHATGELGTHYSAYVYSRQKGNWTSYFYEGREKYFYLDYTLRLCDKLPCPLFCAHSMGDTDVPYSEFVELTGKYFATRFIASCNMHDFDREEDGPFTEKLLLATINFLESHISREEELKKQKI